MNQQHEKAAGNKLLVVDAVIYIKIHESQQIITPFEGFYSVIGYKHGNQLKIKHITSYETKIALGYLCRP